jgi:hypothetical protein
MDSLCARERQGLAKQATVSLRVSTRGEITEFLEQEGRACAYSNQVLSGLIGKLWNYREEGVELSPSIVISDNIAAFGRALPGFSRIQLGCCDATEDAAKRILKDCAPLTGESSLIFIERKDDGKQLSYGIFSFLRTPTAIGIEEALLLDGTQFAVLVKKSAPTTLQLLGSRKNSVSILMSTLRESDNSAKEIERFIADAVGGIDDPEGRFRNYLKRLFDRELSACHGTILICAASDAYPDLDSISDRILLEEGIDFFGHFEDFLKENGAEQLLKLQRAEDVFRGFLGCDGMILFSNTGKIIAYRVFFRAAKADHEKAVVGGARRRAFAGVSALKTNDLKSALFRSQDGTTEYVEIANEPQ